MQVNSNDVICVLNLSLVELARYRLQGTFNNESPSFTTIQNNRCTLRAAGGTVSLQQSATLSDRNMRCYVSYVLVILLVNPQHIIRMIKSLYRITVNTGKHLTREIEINIGLRQGCSLSPTLFNIYAIRQWKILVDPGILIDRGININILVFADDMIVIQDTETKLHKAVFIYQSFLNLEAAI
ncbi:hypothetical protein ANN_20408 [Periplaneta americana]|uniref:Reverse transcriptase domain-containing protein n=1 Tax=Periplaneta americana TaxID=6978 RepID=A0ABQ8SCI2_PERAM|nr:hypothetical protein ANN_20408 [Periplaneta americana]